MRTRALPLMVVTAGLALAQTPAVSTGGVVNGASFVSGQPITGGSLVSIFGSNFASSIAGADSIPLSTSLGGVTVRDKGWRLTTDAVQCHQRFLVPELVHKRRRRSRTEADRVDNRLTDSKAGAV